MGKRSSRGSSYPASTRSTQRTTAQPSIGKCSSGQRESDDVSQLLATLAAMPEVSARVNELLMFVVQRASDFAARQVVLLSRSCGGMQADPAASAPRKAGSMLPPANHQAQQAAAAAAQRSARAFVRSVVSALNSTAHQIQSTGCLGLCGATVRIPLRLARRLAAMMRRQTKRVMQHVLLRLNATFDSTDMRLCCGLFSHCVAAIFESATQPGAVSHTVQASAECDSDDDDDGTSGDGCPTRKRACRDELECSASPVEDDKP